MADDATRIEALEAELRQLQMRHAAEVASLRAEIDQRDRPLAEALEQQAATSEILRVIAG
jgi:hypothetical protein